MFGLVTGVTASLACSLTAWSLYDSASSLLLFRILLVLLLPRLVVVLDQIALFQIGCCLLLGDVSDLSIGGVNGIGQVRE